MKKTLKTILIVLLVIIVIGGCIGGYFIWRHHQLYIGRNAALDAALSDAGLIRAEVFETDADFEKSGGETWYDVDFETHSTKYEYSVDAVSGEILYSYSEPRHGG